MTPIVLAGVSRKVLGSDKPEKCPFRSLKCKGHIYQTHRDDGSSGHAGYMPIAPTDYRPQALRLSSDNVKDPVAKNEYLCDYCGASFWGRTAKTVSAMKVVQADINNWYPRLARDQVLKERFPNLFPETKPKPKRRWHL